MTDYTISVVVPTHNGERYVAETLRCVTTQSHSPLEVIVVDDGSNDRTARTVSDFGPPVRLVSQVQAGPAAARNLGIREAKGRFIAFIDHDDLWRNDKLALQVAEFAADPALDFCVTHIQRFRAVSADGEVELFGPPVPGYLFITMLVRRDAFERVGLLDSSLGHGDHAEWYLRARDKGLSGRLLPQVLTYHRDHETNRSRLLAVAQRSEYLRLAKMRMDKLRGRKDPPGDAR